MNRPQYWTPEEVETLNRMRGEGVAIKDIATTMGRSYLNIVGKCRNLRDYDGLQLTRRSPVREGQPGKTATRKCLHCRGPFLIEHKQNWICPPCQGSEAFR